MLANALTAGVAWFNYGFTSVVTGGTALFDAQDGNPFIAVETVGGAATPEPVTALMTLGGLAGLGLARPAQEEYLSPKRAAGRDRAGRVPPVCHPSCTGFGP